MKELLRTNNEVRLSYLIAMLGQEGIEAEVFDRGFSVTEGSLGAIPRRLMVDEDDYDDAKAILKELGEDW